MKRLRPARSICTPAICPSVLADSACQGCYQESAQACPKPDLRETRYACFLIFVCLIECTAHGCAAYTIGENRSSKKEQEKSIPDQRALYGPCGNLHRITSGVTAVRSGCHWRQNSARQVRTAYHGISLVAGQSRLVHQLLPYDR